MISFRSIAGISVIMASFATWPVLGQSATQTPSRIGNVWNGRAHEPDPSVVQNDLKSKGFAPKPQSDQMVTDEIEDLYQRLIQDEHGHGTETASRGKRSPEARRPVRSAPPQ